MNMLQIEFADIQAWKNIFEAQPVSFCARYGSSFNQIEGIWTNVCTQIPFPHFSCPIDLGVTEPVTEKKLDAVLSHFKQAGLSKFYIHITPVTEPQHALEWLAQRGLRHVSSWHRIARLNAPLEKILPVNADLVVEDVTSENATDWASFIDQVYGMPTKEWLLALISRPGWHHAVCKLEGKIVAARTMKINPDETAYFMIDAPVPGVMTQQFEPDYLISRRLIEIGLEHGVKQFASDIEKPSPSQDTPAYRFWAALGFTVAYEKKNFMY